MGKVETGNIRNVAWVGHGAVGKTTLLEALLFHARAVDRKGHVEDGSSILDFEDEEKARKYSVDSHLCHLDWKGKRFHFIDTPGSSDFVAQAVSAIHNVETVAIVIDAHKGIEVNTRRMFEEAERANVARVIVLSKMDADNVHFDVLVNNIKANFGDGAVLVQVPIGVGRDYKGTVDLLHPPSEFPTGTLVDAAAAREALVEKIVETDDEMLNAYFEGTIPSNQQLFATLTKAVAAGEIIPILCVSGKQDLGLSELLDALSDLAPSPIVGLHRHARHAGQDVELEPLTTKPAAGRVFKAQADKFGNFTFVRVFEGTVRSNAILKDARTGAVHRIGQLLSVQGKMHEKIDEAGPGEFFCAAKVEGVEINDSLSDDGTYELAPMVFPKPMFPLAVNAKTRNDDAKLLQSLRKIVHEDPCFHVHRDEQTGETIMTGISQLHLEVIQNRLRHREHLELVTHEPKIPYKETISKSNEASYRHKKQSGGRGQFAEVHLRLHPRERGTGFEFINSIVGGVIPGQYIPAVEKGIRETMAHGVIAGCEVVDLAAEVFFGKYHDVDSSEQAFKYAASCAFRDAFKNCNPQLLEPIVKIEVVVPSEKMGDINGDLNGRRAHITGMDVLAANLQVVKANVPLAEVLRYQTELKSMTGGQGCFTMEFSHLAPVPPNVQQQVMDKYQKNRKEVVEE